MIRFILNEREIATELPPGTVLLDFIRYQQHLKGTKIGCREGDCGACTVLAGELKNGKLTYRSMTSCLMPMGNAHGKHIVTIEGINDSTVLTPVQSAMAEEGATQCGFCTPGFVVSLTGYCLNSDTPSKKNSIAAIDGNICRCTGYKSIERAGEIISEVLLERKETDMFEFLVGKKILPPYFLSIEKKMEELHLKNISAPKPIYTHSTTVMGGGTDLYVQRHDELISANLEFISEKEKSREIYKENNALIIGGGATVTDLLESPDFNEILPSFKEHARLISSTQIRNMATVAGNLVNASPIGDLSIYLLALNADVELLNKETSQLRKVALKNFYLDYKKLDKLPSEIVVSIRFHIPGPETFFHFEKVSKRTHLDIASVNSAISLKLAGEEITEAAVSAGGVAPVPLFLTKTSRYLIGKNISKGVIAGAIDIIQTEISPISDVRGSSEYKRILLGQLFKAHFITLFPKTGAKEVSVES